MKRAILAIALSAALHGQARTPKAAAPIDLTGYWVSIVDEDWRIRMLNAPKGDYYSLPLTTEARKVADNWDAAKDIAEGKQCMSYGAPGIMRVPGRLHITWENDTTLKLEADAGKQTRTFTFGAPRPATGPATMQGISTAQWQSPQITRGNTANISGRDTNTPGFPGIFNGETEQGPDTRNLGGSLKVLTSHLRPGYLRNNGVPYSANTVMTEYFVTHKWKGEEYLVVTQSVEDPQNLTVPWVTSNHFRRERDGAKWDPRPCELILPSK
jgi:hypothetical protein